MQNSINSTNPRNCCLKVMKERFLTRKFAFYFTIKFRIPIELNAVHSVHTYIEMLHTQNQIFSALKSNL